MIPRHTQVRVFRTDAWDLTLACHPARPHPADVRKPGTVSALLMMPAGARWPDKAGEELMQEVLKGGGLVVLKFRALPDALACRARINVARGVH